jgi:hypothetical protein
MGRLRSAWFLARIIASGNFRSQKRQLNSDDMQEIAAEGAISNRFQRTVRCTAHR